MALESIVGNVKIKTILGGHALKQFMLQRSTSHCSSPPNLKSCTKLCLASTNVGIYGILKYPIIQGAHMFRTSRVIALPSVKILGK